jgi:hypothetical protein
MTHTGGRPHKYATQAEKKAAHREQKAAYKRRQAMQKQSAKDANKSTQRQPVIGRSLADVQGRIEAPEPTPVASEKQPPVAPVHPRVPTHSTRNSKTPVFPQTTEATKIPQGHLQRPVGRWPSYRESSVASPSIASTLRSTSTTVQEDDSDEHIHNAIDGIDSVSELTRKFSKLPIPNTLFHQTLIII